MSVLYYGCKTRPSAGIRNTTYKAELVRPLPGADGGVERHKYYTTATSPPSPALGWQLGGAESCLGIMPWHLANQSSRRQIANSVPPRPAVARCPDSSVTRTALPTPRRWQRRHGGLAMFLSVGVHQAVERSEDGRAWRPTTPTPLLPQSLWRRERPFVMF